MRVSQYEDCRALKHQRVGRVTYVDLRLGNERSLGFQPEIPSLSLTGKMPMLRLETEPSNWFAVAFIELRFDPGPQRNLEPCTRSLEVHLHR